MYKGILHTAAISSTEQGAYYIFLAKYITIHELFTQTPLFYLAPFLFYELIKFQPFSAIK
jgi:hypothetical protein